MTSSLRSRINSFCLVALFAAALIAAAAPAHADTPFAHGIVTFAFDDGYQSFADNAAPVLDAAGIDATIYIYSQVVEDGGSDFMDAATLQAMHAAGHDVGGHSVTHPDLTTLGAAQLKAEIEDNRTYLQGLGLGPVSSFAYPFGAFDGTVSAAVAAGEYTAARTVDQGLDDTDPFNFSDSDLLTLKTEYVRQTEDTTDSVIAAIDKAMTDKTWLIITFHEVADPFPAGCTAGADSEECVSKAFLQTLVDHIAANSDICTLTVDEVLNDVPCPTEEPEEPTEDTTPAEITISYSTTDATTSPVMATASANEDGEFTNDGGATHEFTANGSFDFVFADLAGNISTSTATVSNIGTDGGSGGDGGEEEEEGVIPSCPEGYTLTGGECVSSATYPATCPTGYELNEGTCVPQTHAAACAEGTLNAETGMCEFEGTPVSDPICNAGDDYIADQDMCMTFDVFPVDFYAPSCPEGSTLNTGTDKCESIPAPVAACASGFTYQDEQCVSDGSGDVAPGCPEGVSGTVSGGICTPDPVPASCPDGLHVSEDGTKCVEETPVPTPTCNDNQRLENNVCVDIPRSSGGGGGGGGGGGRISTPVTTTATSTGSVLGAATSSCFQFTRSLSRGMTGADVMELQTKLKTDGFLGIDTPTTYFGPMTEAAVTAFQAKNGLDQVGIVGPKTRALLNACGGMANPNQALIDELTAKLNSLLEQIKQLLAEQGQK